MWAHRNAFARYRHFVASFAAAFHVAATRAADSRKANRGNSIVAGQFAKFPRIHAPVSFVFVHLNLVSAFVPVVDGR
jgi:hypothetical protein